MTGKISVDVGRLLSFTFRASLRGNFDGRGGIIHASSTSGLYSVKSVEPVYQDMDEDDDSLDDVG